MMKASPYANHGLRSALARVPVLCLVLAVHGAVEADDETPVLQTVVLTNDSSTDPVEYGVSVAIDGETLMIGNPSCSHPDRKCGCVVVYTLVEGQWELTQQLFPPRPASNSQFGHDIALSKNTAVISTLHWGGVQEMLEKHADDQAGVCYEFRKVDGAWTFQAEIVGSDRHRYDHFGCSVDMDGDILVIGSSPLESDRQHTGAVYVFVRSDDGRWKQQCRIISDDIATAPTFGERVRIDGGIVGILGGGGLQRPARNVVHVYELVGAEWTKTATLGFPVYGSEIVADSFEVCQNMIVVGCATPIRENRALPRGGACV